MAENVADYQPVRENEPEGDAVVIVRRALERGESGSPLFPGENKETKAAVQELEKRLARLKTLGVEFADVELSVYARQLAAGNGRIQLAS